MNVSKVENRWARAIATVVTGACIGWFVGMSVSPVVNLVVSGLLTAIAGALGLALVLPGAASGGEESDAESKPPSEKKTRPARRIETPVVPLAFLTVGLVVGTTLGVMARASRCLAPDRNEIINTWVSLGVSKEVVVQRIFDEEHPLSGSSGESKEESASGNKAVAETLAVLHSAVPEKEYLKLQQASDDTIQGLMLDSQSEGIRKFAASCSDPKILHSAVRWLICSKK